MTKEEAIIRYKSSMYVFKNWREKGLISEEELLTIDTIMTKKYSLSLSSIYRSNDLIYKENRANMG